MPNMNLKAPYVSLPNCFAFAYNMHVPTNPPVDTAPPGSESPAAGWDEINRTSVLVSV